MLTASPVFTCLFFYALVFSLHCLFSGMSLCLGIVEPIPLLPKANSLGLGKAEEYEQMAIEATKTRKGEQKEFAYQNTHMRTRAGYHINRDAFHIMSFASMSVFFSGLMFDANRSGWCLVYETLFLPHLKHHIFLSCTRRFSY